MLKTKLTLLVLLVAYSMQAQEVGLPLDLRQHNLTDSNSSILNPATSVDYENPQSVGLWTRWQWQTVDSDPTTLFINYVGRLDDSSSMGAGFYQHNTGVFLNTGAVFNYAYTHRFSDRARLSFGLNVFAFLTELADDRFQIDPQIQLPLQSNLEDFIIQVAPGIQFTYDRLSVGLVSENLFGYNVTTKESSPYSEDKIFLGTVAYDFPMNIIKSDDTSVLRPMLYVKTIPGYDTQVGLQTVLMTNRFWAQTGYNSFYGFSVGAGGKFFRRLSIGALVELGSKPELKGKDPSFELVTAFDFGKIDAKRKVKPLDEQEEEKPLEEIAEADKVDRELAKAEEIAARRKAKELEIQQRKQTKDSLDQVRREEAIAANLQKREERRKDSIDRAKKAESVAIARNISRQKRLDSLAAIKKQREIAVAQRQQEQVKLDSLKKATEAKALADAQRRQEQIKLDSIKEVEKNRAIAQAQQERQQQINDSITKAKIAAAELERQAEAAQEQVAELTEEDKPKAGEKYEEAVGEDGLTPGYYLIANVFGTKKYFDIFMADLTKKGLQPKTFFRSLNKYNYVYLERYNTMSEAREARDGKFGGRYQDKTWIYRVVAK